MLKFCYIWINILYQRHFSIIYHLFIILLTLEIVKIKYTIWIFYFDWLIPVKVRQSFKKNRMEFYSIKVRPSSLIDFDQSFLWLFTLLKFASKKWPNFLVQENFDSVNGALVLMCIMLTSQWWFFTCCETYPRQVITFESTARFWR